MKNVTSAHETLLSRDGVAIGPIVGIHRDTRSQAALWAVVDGGERRLLVPMAGAVVASGTVRVSEEADRILSSPPVADPTRLQPAEGDRLRHHYGSAAPGGSGGPGGEPGVSVVRSEERLEVRKLEWRPYQNVRLRTVVRSREETHVVQVSWEELVVENEPVSAVERLEVSSGLSRPDTSDVNLVLHREEVTVTKRVVPYEWVRATRSAVTEEIQVTDTVRKEQVEIEEGPAVDPSAAREPRRGRRR